VAPAFRADDYAFSNRHRRLGGDHRDTLRSATHLASDLRALGQLEQARQLDQETVTHRQGADLPAATVAVDQHEVYLA